MFVDGVEDNGIRVRLFWRLREPPVIMKDVEAVEEGGPGPGKRMIGVLGGGRRGVG